MIERAKKISFKNLANHLGLNDSRAVQKWLDTRKIPYSREGRDNYVHLWLVEFEKALDFVHDLKKRFPKTWPRLFESQINDVELVKAVYEIIPPTNTVTKIERTNGTKQFFK